MVYETLVEQIKTVPQECLADIETYIQYILYRYNQPAEKEKHTDLSKYFGSVKFHQDALKIQKEMRNEWN